MMDHATNYDLTDILEAMVLFGAHACSNPIAIREQQLARLIQDIRCKKEAVSCSGCYLRYHESRKQAV